LRFAVLIELKMLVFHFVLYLLSAKNSAFPADNTWDWRKNERGHHRVVFIVYEDHGIEKYVER